MFLFSLLFFQMKNACFWSIVALLAIVLSLATAQSMLNVTNCPEFFLASRMNHQVTGVTKKHITRLVRQ